MRADAADTTALDDRGQGTGSFVMTRSSHTTTTIGRWLYGFSAGCTVSVGRWAGCMRCGCFAIRRT